MLVYVIFGVALVLALAILFLISKGKTKPAEEPTIAIGETPEVGEEPTDANIATEEPQEEPSQEDQQETT